LYGSIAHFVILGVYERHKLVGNRQSTGFDHVHRSGLHARAGALSTREHSRSQLGSLLLQPDSGE
jgi:hypothetical protein